MATLRQLLGYANSSPRSGEFATELENGLDADLSLLSELATSAGAFDVAEGFQKLAEAVQARERFAAA